MFILVYIYEELVKWFVNTPENILHVNFLGYAHWFMSISVSQIEDRYISVNEARYATSIVEKYIDTATIKKSTIFHETTLAFHLPGLQPEGKTRIISVKEIRGNYCISGCDQHIPIN